MIIAIGSGKGGTGKTTIAVNLAKSLEEKITLLDCDVEEPNAQIFIQGKKIKEEEVSVPIPWVQEELCSECAKCSHICQFNAIVSFNTIPLIFPELCHSCGGCIKICPTQALQEKEYPLGVITTYQKEHITLLEGKLNIGHPMAPPLIKRLKKNISSSILTLIDAPPGTSCPFITTVKKADFVLLVTEPTPFGLNDLQLAVETIKELQIPYGVIINKDLAESNLITDYCDQESIPVLLRIPNNQEIAKIYSQGKILIEEIPLFKQKFVDLMNEIKKLTGGK